MSPYLSLIERRRGWALITFFCLYDGRLFEVGANSRLGAYSNKYGSYDRTIFSFFFLLAKGTEENASMHIIAIR